MLFIPYMLHLEIVKATLLRYVRWKPDTS